MSASSAFVEVYNPVADTDSDTAEWRAVVGYEGFYEVSDGGDVRRVGQRVKGARIGRYLRQRRNARYVYYQVVLCVGRVKRAATVHSIVAAAFIGPRPESLEINHKDGNKLNNRADNLEYVTKSQNAKHAHDEGFARWSKQRKDNAAMLGALKRLVIDANRLCDRNLGGSYEDDCRRSVDAARAAIAQAEAK